MSRRLTDIAISLLSLIILSPLLVILSIVNLATSRDNPFFIQQRVGKKGKLFWLIKFRTMRRGSESSGQLTIWKDSRVTRFGKFLRRTKLDEMPQLLNVLTGRMSLVGPRPEVPKYVAYYNQQQRHVLNSRPGLTDPASLQFINESTLLGRFDDPERGYIEEIMPEKLRINLQYLERRTWRSDMNVILRTVGRILGR